MANHTPLKYRGPISISNRNRPAYLTCLPVVFSSKVPPQFWQGLFSGLFEHSYGSYILPHFLAGFICSIHFPLCQEGTYLAPLHLPCFWYDAYIHSGNMCDARIPVWVCSSLHFAVFWSLFSLSFNIPYI